MTLKSEFLNIDSEQLIRVAESVQKKLVTSSNEYIQMFDATFDEFPAFTELTCYLYDKYEARDDLSECEKKAAIVGAGTVLLILREHVTVEEMNEKFPDIPKA